MCKIRFDLGSFTALVPFFQHWRQADRHPLKLIHMPVYSMPYNPTSKNLNYSFKSHILFLPLCPPKPTQRHKYKSQGKEHLCTMKRSVNGRQQSNKKHICQHLYGSLCFQSLHWSLFLSHKHTLLILAAPSLHVVGFEELAVHVSPDI